MGAEVIRIGALYTQVCVPEEWTDQEVVDFTEADNPCGAFAGWHVRKAGGSWLSNGKDKLGGYPERNPCADRPGHVHIILDC